MSDPSTEYFGHAEAIAAASASELVDGLALIIDGETSDGVKLQALAELFAQPTRARRFFGTDSFFVDVPGRSYIITVAETS